MISYKDISKLKFETFLKNFQAPTPFPSVRENKERGSEEEGDVGRGIREVKGGETMRGKVWGIS